MKRSMILLIFLITGRLFAITLEEFEPYNMYGNPREKLEDCFSFAKENNIPVFFNDEIGFNYALPDGKLYAIYKESLNEHTFYHVFYSLGVFNPGNYSSNYDENYPPKDCTKEEFENWPFESIRSDILGEPFPRMFQALYFQTDEGFVLLGKDPYFEAEKGGQFEMDTFQPWDNGMGFGYWVIFAFKQYRGDDPEKILHGAARYAINDDGETVRKISISASAPLLDAKNPYQYTIQNAFDQNPATSYVEDTEDDLMKVEIRLPLNYPEMHKGERRIINGYASNEYLYKLNNRIKEITLYDGSSFQLKDFSLISQTTPSSTGIDLLVTSLYEGEKYSDTCLAEYDYLIDSDYYLFGGYCE